jgi:hypothetical protein
MSLNGESTRTGFGSNRRGHPTTRFQIYLGFSPQPSISFSPTLDMSFGGSKFTDACYASMIGNEPRSKSLKKTGGETHCASPPDRSHSDVPSNAYLTITRSDRVQHPSCLVT